MEKEELSLEPIKDKDKIAVVLDEETGKPLGLEGYKPPSQFGYLKIDQKTGELEYTLTGEKKKAWQVVVANFNYSRIMFDKDMVSPEPICKTIERKQDQNQLEGTKYGKCIACEYAEWKDDTKPPCRLSLNLTGLLGGNLVTPVGVTCRGANYKIGTQLLEWFRKSNISPWNVVLEVSTKGPFKRGSVEYYTLNFRQVGVTPQDVSDTISAMYIETGGMPIFTKEEENPETKEAEKELDKALDGAVEDIPFD